MMTSFKLVPKQAAARLQVSVSLIYAWLKEGLPHDRLGRAGRRGRILIDAADLERFLASRRRIIQNAPILEVPS